MLARLTARLPAPRRRSSMSIGVSAQGSAASSRMTAVRVGLTLPSFQTEPDKVLVVARAAEDAGLDGVFLFDHLFRRRGDAFAGLPQCSRG